MGFWSSFGHGLAKVAVLAAKGAVWASENPQIVKTVGGMIVAVDNDGDAASQVNKAEAGITIAGNVLKNTPGLGQ